MNTLGKIFTVAAVTAVATYLASRAGVRHSPEQADRQLRDDICDRLAGLDINVEAIEVVVNAGDVSLRGNLPASEVDAVLNCVLAMPRVRHIHNRLTALDDGMPRSTMQDAMQIH